MPREDGKRMAEMFSMEIVWRIAVWIGDVCLHAIDGYSRSRKFMKKAGQTGLAVIVNYSHKRHASEADVERLKTFFVKIVKYHVEIVEDKAKSTLMQTFESIRKNEMTSKAADKYHCFVLVMMCHGKPKFFIFQACRHQPGTRTDESDNLESQNLKEELHQDADLLVSYATTPGYKAYRELYTTEEGSWFIREMINVFKERYEETDVINIMMEVRRKVEKCRTSNGEFQMTQDLLTLRKKFFL
ncbi:CASP3 [Mytilus edulis]|uniref:CASP3 n=1 Tax=Mytilus edulis TaxID=6550 RepID=A0A8S3Q899_MYTED|nr:CASP3 [Mytilus edulis]